MTKSDTPRGGVSDWHTGRRHDAVEAVAQLLGDNPSSGFAYVWRAKALVDKGEWARAVADFDPALKLDPASKEAREGRERAQSAVRPNARAR